LSYLLRIYTENGRKSPLWLKYTNTNGHELDRLVPKNEIPQACIKNSNPAISEKIERLRRITTKQKTDLEHLPQDIKMQISNLNKDLENMKA